MGGVAERLREEMEARKRRNSRYSMRALARDLDVSHSYLSLLLRGKRQPSLAQVLAFAQRLQWPASEATAIALSGSGPAPKRRSTPARFREVERDHYRLLADWYHLPLLDLTTLAGFEATAPAMASRLGISLRETTRALARLERCGLIERTAAGWKKSTLKIFFPTATRQEAVRRYHRQMIAKALLALRSRSRRDFERRDITAITFAANPAHLAAAKKKVQAFRRRLQAFLAEGECSELYQLNIQLFPLTIDE